MSEVRKPVTRQKQPKKYNTEKQDGHQSKRSTHFNVPRQQDQVTIAAAEILAKVINLWNQRLKQYSADQTSTKIHHNNPLQNPANPLQKDHQLSPQLDQNRTRGLRNKPETSKKNKDHPSDKLANLKTSERQKSKKNKEDSANKNKNPKTEPVNDVELPETQLKDRQPKKSKKIIKKSPKITRNTRKQRKNAASNPATPQKDQNEEEADQIEEEADQIEEEAQPNQSELVNKNTETAREDNYKQQKMALEKSETSSSSLKILKRASYHVAISYFMHIKIRQANGIDISKFNELDPTVPAQKIKDNLYFETQ